MKVGFVLSVFMIVQLGIQANPKHVMPINTFFFKFKPLIFADFFSPNGDGHNDTYVIENIEEYPINKLYVFNRYGEIVYTSEPYRNDWNGTMNIDNQLFGNVLPEALYFYRFEYLVGDFLERAAGKIILKR